MTRNSQPIRVGVVGVGRGRDFASRSTALLGMKLVAICDVRRKPLQQLGRQFGVATYTDYDQFLKHDLDAVVLANYFHQHAPLAIKALAAGKHVMSETSACKTLAEGVALCRAVERTGQIYMFAENYPFTVFNLEMRRLYQAGEIGRVLYAEGEYNHPMSPDDYLGLSPGRKHWRNWIPGTYYCTHALAPLMHITDTVPVSVNALVVPAVEVREATTALGDPTSVILCRMDNGAVFRLFGLFTPGHSCWWRLHGTRGAMENVRGPGYFGPGKVRVWHEQWNRRPRQPTERVYRPDWPEHGDLARRAGHGGGDFFTSFHFAQAIRAGRQPYLDVYRGVAMSAVGILGWKSALANGRPFPMPDFKNERARQPFASDHWSPFPEDAGPGQPPPSLAGRRPISRPALAHARAVWRRTA